MAAAENLLVTLDAQGRTVGLARAGWLLPGDQHLGRQAADGTITLEPCRVERIERWT